MNRYHFIGLGVLIACIGVIALLLQRSSVPERDWDVIQGDAEISEDHSERTLTIHQSTRRAILRTSSGFVVDPTKLHITTDHPDATTLIIDESGIPSRILGKLSSDGSIKVINPAGIIVGPDARIDFESPIVESTLDTRSE
ncbi:MAG: hypothetical protein CMO55_24545 [Verrucomicrobiales bacterium]|nr:hypothetical protein [Verrucomicrobiales bacterium]